MLPQEIIRRKREGEKLGAAEIRFIIEGLTDGSVSEGQVAAFAMATFLRGMDSEEVVALTEAMRDSGTVLDWDHLDGPVVDKHSTGGIGDNVSLMLAPTVAACGVFVPMISGRGLGHTGGTLDKLDAIPGYSTQPSIEHFRDVVAKVGTAIIGQTADLAPADKRLYAIRDVTATVESVALITASILSKKLAAGLHGLVLDVKTGTGAFMRDPAEARALAESLVAVANGAGVRTTALITDMNEPLASAAGNAVEVRNAVDFLTGAARDPRLYEVIVALGSEMLMLAGVASDPAEAGKRIEAAIGTGQAVEIFGRMVVALGGPADFVDHAGRYLPVAPVQQEILAERDGHVAAIDGRAIGMAVVELGGGRRTAGDAIDLSVGVTALAGLGHRADRQSPIGVVHARTKEEAEHAAALIRAAYAIADEPPRPGLVIRERIAG